MFKLIIHTDNAAFDDGLHRELARLLRIVQGNVSKGVAFGSLQDLSGDTVGRYYLHDDEQEEEQ